MREIILFSIAVTVMLAGILTWATRDSAGKAAFNPPQVDPFSFERNAKNLPDQDWLNAHMWPNNTT